MIVLLKKCAAAGICGNMCPATIIDTSLQYVSAIRGGTGGYEGRGDSIVWWAS